MLQEQHIMTEDQGPKRGRRVSPGAARKYRLPGERGGWLPYGYKRQYDPDTGHQIGIAVHEAEAAVIRRIRQEHSQGKGLSAIAKLLNDEQVPTRQGGKQWYASTIQVILDNEPIYRGALRGDGPDHWPVILSDEP